MRVVVARSGRRPPVDESENTFPMDIREGSSRPWNFRPGGYLVVILASDEEARRAEGALVAKGFASRDIKLYTGKQILANQEEYVSRRGVPSRIVGSVVDDIEGRALYLGYARDDRVYVGRIPTRARSRWRSGSSPTTTIFTPATTVRRNKPTITSLHQPARDRLTRQPTGLVPASCRAAVHNSARERVRRSSTCAQENHGSVP